jgi:hypothetical protein
MAPPWKRIVCSISGVPSRVWFRSAARWIAWEPGSWCKSLLAWGRMVTCRQIRLGESGAVQARGHGFFARIYVATSASSAVMPKHQRTAVVASPL